MRCPKPRSCRQRYFMIAAIIVGVMANGCHKEAKSDDAQTAIRAALQQHLSQQSNLNLSAMDMNVENVTVNGSRAQARVQFRLRQNNVSMDMLYDLELHGGTWIVTHSQPAGGQFSHPPMDKAHSTTPN